MKELSILNKLLFLINSLSLILLLLSYISPYINPNIFWPISFLGLVFPILFIINSLFLVYWFALLKKQMWANLIILFFGLQYLGDYIGTNPKENDDPSTIKVLSYNVRIFNAYKWIPDLDKETIFNFFREESAEILCIQEFYAPKKIPKLGYSFKHIGMQNKKNQWHMAIYSKYPQINKSSVKIKGKKMNNTCIYSDIKILNDTVRVYNLHLASNFFKTSDYSFLTDNIIKKEKIKEGIISIIKRLKNSYQERAEEVIAIREHMTTSPFPIIVCGDFNDTPLSYAYHKIKGNLIDSFSSSGKGLGESFVKIPGLRIDYIMHDKSFKSFNYHKKDDILSDHYAISCEIKI